MSRLDELRKLSTNARTGYTHSPNACAVVGLDKYVECYDRLCRNCIFHTETYRRVTSLEETIRLVDELEEALTHEQTESIK